MKSLSESVNSAQQTIVHFTLCLYGSAGNMFMFKYLNENRIPEDCRR